ncbi:MAG: AraC family transcriptional regulator [Lachnospiraceae bacterium]|nr:AraC family transcriptional regulator [Lachnospiraceae bacterium]
MEYIIDGDRNCFLLPMPLSEEMRKHLIYFQSFDYIESSARYYTKRKNFRSYLLLFTYEGQGHLEYQGNSYTLSKGDIAIIDCMLPHEYRTSGSFWFHADLHFYGGNSTYMVPALFRKSQAVMHPANFQILQAQLEKMLRTIEQNQPFHTSIELQQLLFLISDDNKTKVEENNCIPENLKYLRLYIEKHFLDDLTLDMMADLAGITKFHFCREYKRHFGFSPKEYIMHLRMLHAEMLLQSTTIPSYRIAQISGFSSEANFISQFKKAHQMTPGQYRSTRR